MKQPVIQASRIVVVMPNWLGDGVMATPFLRALRGLYPAARIAAAARPLVAPVCEGLVDETGVFGKGDEGKMVRWMRAGKFELGVLLPNSFRSAWTMWRGRVKRRLGYARGGRSLLLTDRIKPLLRTGESHRHWMARRWALGVLQDRSKLPEKSELAAVIPSPDSPKDYEIVLRTHSGEVRHRERAHDMSAVLPLLRDFQPVPSIDYYLKLARYLGSGEADASRQMRLSITEAEKDEAEKALQEFEISNLKSQISDFKSQISNYVVLVPGANFGASKCWLPERFAAVAERLADPAGPFGAQVILAGSPAEMAICEAIAAGVSKHSERVHVLGRLNGGKGVSIGALKEIVRRSRMMICNDTGPRHIAAAFGVPVVTLFGPTDPVWAETFFEKERIVRVEVPCGPCQLKKCPIDHRCMKGITVEMVMAAAEELWNAEA